MRKGLALVFAVWLIVLCGCAAGNSDFAEEDPITEYDSVQNVKVEGVGGHFTVREKKYTFGEGDLMILRADNATGKNCSIEIEGTYKKADGSAVKKETKEFRDFSADDSNYFFFDPGIPFDDFSYEITLLDADAMDLSGCWLFSTHAYADCFDGSCPEEYKDDVIFKSTMSCRFPPENLNIDLEVLTFDNEGEPVNISRAGRAVVTSDLHTLANDLCEVSDGKYIIPERLRGDLRCVTSMIKIYTEAEWNERTKGIG